MPAPPSMVGTRVYSDGFTKDHRPSLISTIVAFTTLLVYTGWMNWLLGLIIWSFFNKYVLCFVVALFSTLALPARPILWPAFNRLWVFKTWREYFSFSYYLEEACDPTKRYIFAEFPHGAFPIAAITAGTVFQTLFPDFKVYSVAASSVFYIPFWRHFIAWIGSQPASRQNIQRLLKDGSVAIVVGGIAEMYMQDPTKERIKLRGRKGFAKIAIDEGIDGIVPVYYFGQTKMMDFRPHSLEGMARKLRAAVGVMWGLWGLPVPRPIPAYMVSGKPVPVPKVSQTDPDYEKKVDDLLESVIQSLQDMYDRHKVEYGWADRPLSIE